MLFRHCQSERGAALQPFGETRKPLEVHCVQLQCIQTMNPFSAKPYRQLRGIFVCIHRDASRRLARTMQACRLDRKSTRLNSSHVLRSRMPSSA